MNQSWGGNISNKVTVIEECLELGCMHSKGQSEEMVPDKKLKIMIIDIRERKYFKSTVKSNILSALRQKTTVDDVWILVDTERKLDFKSEPLEFNYKFFEDYQTDSVAEIYKLEKPDIILVDNDYDWFLRSFVITANAMKIPIVLTFLTSMFEDYLQKRDIGMLQGKIAILRDKARYIIKKFLFMLKTYRETGTSYIKILKIIINEIRFALFYYDQIGRNGCDLVIAVGDSAKRTLEKKGVKAKIVVTGHPLFDNLLKKAEMLRASAKIKTKKKIVLMTTGLIEHGLETKKQWESTMKGILDVINGDFTDAEFVIKIHPTTERIGNYDNLLKKLNYNNKIIQTTPLEEVIFDADLIISFGYSGGTWEALLLKRQMIIANFIDYDIEKMPFVKKDILKQVRTTDALREEVRRCLSNTITQQNISDFITDHVYRLDGRSGDRIAEAILQLKNEFEDKGQ